MEKVNKFIRASRYGKTIVCPYCNTETRVYHFGWSAITCGAPKNKKETECNNRVVKKYEWLIKK